MTKVFVTGGAGFIGNHLVNRLISENFKVVIYDNLFRGRFPSSVRNHNSVHFVYGDLRDNYNLQRSIEDAEIVFHLGAQANVVGATNDIKYCLSTNILGTLNLLKVSKAAGVRRIIFTSSKEVYGEVTQLPVKEETPLRFKNLYGFSKVVDEYLCYLFNNIFHLPVVVLRLTNVYGPGDTDRVIPVFLDRAKADSSLVVYGGKQIIDFVWIDQVVEALFQSINSPLMGIPINVGSGKGTPILDLAQSIINLTNSSSTIELKPERNMETTSFIADLTRMKEALYLTPFIDLQTGLRRIIESKNHIDSDLYNLS